MANALENNTLFKIDLEIHSASTSLESITGLLSKHTSSIRDVVIEASASTQWSFDEVLDFLGQNRISLRRLTIDVNPLSSQRLLDYISCFGTQIEILEGLSEVEDLAIEHQGTPLFRSHSGSAF
eukprot:gene5502-6057_t